MLAVLVTYLNRFFGWDELEDQQEDGIGGAGATRVNKDNTATGPTTAGGGNRGGFGGGLAQRRAPITFTRILFHNNNDNNGETAANNNNTNSGRTAQDGNSNNIYEQRRQQLHRYNRPSSNASSNAELRQATSTSSLMTSSSSSHNQSSSHTPRRKMLRVRADTVGGGMNSYTRSAAPKLSPTSEGSAADGNQQSNGLKFPFELWFEGAGQPKAPEKPRFGNLEFSTYFDSTDNSFAVKVIRATDLPVMDLFGLTDPFVKCCLLPDRKRKLETKVKRRTLDPHWNEEFMFQGLSIEKIKHRVLSLQVYDFDRFSRNDPIGDVFLPLRDLQLNQETFHSIDLAESQGSNKRGELQLSLCYQPLEGIIDVAIVKAKNLKPMDINGMSDPYVKVWLIYRGKKVEKKKTDTIKRTLNPTFDEEFTFLTPMNKMRETQLEITVMDYDKIGRNDTIGKVYLGHKSSGLEKQHWKDMLNSARQPVSQWHVLKV